MARASSRWSGKQKRHREHSLSRKVAGYTVLVTVLVAVLVTAIQSYLHYQQDIQDLQTKRVNVITSSFLETIRINAWEYDLDELRLQLQGLLQVPDIVYAEVSFTAGESLFLGDPPGDSSLSFHFPLKWTDEGESFTFGELRVASSLAITRANLMDELQQSIISTVSIVAALAICILLVVQRLIASPLNAIADYARRLTLDRLHVPLQLNRKTSANKDELDYVVAAFNKMRLTLIEDLEQMSQLSAEVQRKRQELQSIIDNSPAAITLTGLDGRLILVSKAYARIFNTSAEALIGRREEELYQGSPPIEETDRWVHQSKQPVEFEERVPLPDGIHTYLTIKFPLFDQHHQLWAIGEISTDITTRKKSEQDLAESQARLLALVESLDDAVLEVDRNGICVQSWNNKWPLDINPVGRNLTEISSQHTSAELLSLVRQVLASGESRTLEFIYSSPERRWLSARISAIETPGQPSQTVCILCRDITEQKIAEERLQRMAHYDVLTGLPNRSFLHEHLQMLIANASRHGSQLAVLFIDLDRLKMVNDSLGHGVGDLLIKAAAERIRDCLRDADTVVRQGGDEFIVALPDIPRDELAVHVAEKILHSLTHPFKLGNHEVVVTASIGISYFPKDGRNADILIKNADAAMYAAKASGRNNYQIYAQDMSNKDVSRRLSLQHGLRRALDRDELCLHYQPQVDVKTGAIIGAEALIRWRHPRLGLVSPGIFIPLAEDTGLIHPIGSWALQEACQQYQQWQKEGLPPFLLAINLSSLQFRQKNIIRLITDTLSELDMPPENLELELTESTVMAYTEDSINTLQTLKAMGLKLAIDDFGTGYSSLSYLKRFPVDKLKIDQSFIRDIDHDPEDAAIAAAVIALAKTLGMEVIAEGVQSRAAFQFLKDHQCDQIQGYLFSHPLPAKEFATLLASEKRLELELA